MNERLLQSEDCDLPSLCHGKMEGVRGFLCLQRCLEKVREMVRV